MPVEHRSFNHLSRDPETGLYNWSTAMQLSTYAKGRGRWALDWNQAVHVATSNAAKYEEVRHAMRSFSHKRKMYGAMQYFNATADGQGSSEQWRGTMVSNSARCDDFTEEIL